MSGFLSLMRYIRLKLLISLIRFISKFITPPVKANPDQIVKISSRDKQYAIKAHVYQPSVDPLGSRSQGPRPVLLNFCGTGFVLPSHGTDDEFCRHVATAAGYTVLDVEYRLAPEHPFPAAVNDAQDAVQYVIDHPEKYKTSQISLSGFSSGGTLALILPTLFPRGFFKSVIAFYPATDLAKDPGLRKAPSPDAKPRSAGSTRLFRQAYLRDMDPRDPRISPAYADISDYPKNMLVVTGEMDTSALEAEKLAEKAKDEGLPDGRNVVIRRMKGCGHAFDKKKKKGDTLIQAKGEAYGLAVDMLKSAANESG